jgi:hypothetical protein
MRQQTKPLGSLTWGDWVKERCALLPLDCISRSRPSECPAEKVLASPALGAELVEYLLKLDVGSPGASRGRQCDGTDRQGMAGAAR